MDSLNKIKSMDPNLRNGMIPAEEYDVLVVGRNVSSTEGDVKKIKFVETTNPTSAADKAGVEKQNYLRASFTRTGAIVKSTWLIVRVPSNPSGVFTGRTLPTREYV